jgi:D-alanyl-D-alanine carboxypeptidase
MMPDDLLPGNGASALSRRGALKVMAGGLAMIFTVPAALRRSDVRAQSPGKSGSTPAYAFVLQPKLEQLVQQLLVPGAAVVVQSAELGDWAAAFGTRVLGGTEPVTLSDHVRIGSNTKTMTGTVILQLVEEGKITLDDPVSRYRPDVPNGDQITIRNLLTMRSGLYNYSESLELNRSLDETPLRVWSPDELLAIAFRHPPSFAPGAKYEYSNTNFILLGMIIEQLTGNLAEVEFQRRIFAPLGLTETILPALSSNAIPDPHPQGYMYGTNVETISSSALPADQQAQAADGTLLPTDVTEGNPSWAWTAGSGISTAGELVRYVKALVGGGLLGSDMQAQRLASMQPTDPSNPASTKFGLALADLGPMLGFIGDIPGFNSLMGHDPKRDITVVTWTLLSAAPDGTPPATALGKAIIAELYGPSYVPASGGVPGS